MTFLKFTKHACNKTHKIVSSPRVNKKETMQDIPQLTVLLQLQAMFQILPLSKKGDLYLLIFTSIFINFGAVNAVLFLVHII